VPQRLWAVCVGEYSGFSVLDPIKMKSLFLCSGHNSPTVDVVYLNGLLHSRCESSSIYSWNIDGQLMSKHRSKILKRVGQLASVNDQDNAASHPEMSLDDGWIVPTFSHVVPLGMPNYQTFAFVLHVIEFLNVFDDYSELQIQNNPLFLLLFLL
jgi:hypothetical protein